MKSDNLAIGYAIILQQIVKFSPDQQTANKKLYQIGRQMGQRMCDQFNCLECLYLSPSQTIKALLIKISKDSLGIVLQLVEQNIKYEKRNHFYNLTYKQSGLTKSIIGLCEDIDDRFQSLEPCQVVAGFLYGVLQTMDFYGQVVVERSQGQRQKNKYVIAVKKDIKQED